MASHFVGYIILSHNCCFVSGFYEVEFLTGNLAADLALFSTLLCQFSIFSDVYKVE